MIRAAVVGGAGYIGGELVRLLLQHPEVDLVAVTSSSQRGRAVSATHPNLRGYTELRYVDRDSLPTVDVVMLATPHGETMDLLPDVEAVAPLVIDLSGDHRLRNPETYELHYGKAHSRPEALADFVTGLPEAFRDELAVADRISVPGCMATAGMLALLPLSREHLLDGEVFASALTGSSGSGSGAGPQNQHAERSGAMRLFAPTGHRHSAEIAQLTDRPVRMTATGVEAVRGVQVTCTVRLTESLPLADVHALYRRSYKAEPFIRVIAERRGHHRLPEPKILSGTNLCDVGFAVPDGEADVITAVAALDNLGKGGASAAVQCLNIRRGWPETLGLGFAGLHPI